MADSTFTVIARWDEEARVWVAQSDDVPGLVTEAENEEQLVATLREMIPELLELNNSPRRGEPIDVLLRFEREARLSMPSAA